MGIIKGVMALVAVVAVFVLAFQVAPPMMASYSFSDDLKTIALVDSPNPAKMEDDIRNDVMKKVREHDLPIDAKQVLVQRINTPGTSAVYVEADYAVTINLPGYSFDMHFTPSSGNKNF